MLALVLFHCLTLVVQVVGAPTIVDILHSDQSNGTLHIVGHPSCRRSAKAIQYKPKQAVSASVYSFGLFTESKEFSLGVKVAISCVHRTVYSLLSLGDWEISVNCVDYFIRFGLDSFRIQEKTIHSLRMSVIDSSVATLQIDNTFTSRPVNSSQISEKVKLLIAPERQISKDVTVHQIVVVKDQQRMTQYGNNMHVEIHVKPVVTVNDVVNITFRSMNDDKIHFYKVLIPGIGEEKIHCAEMKCTVQFPVAGVFSCMLQYTLHGRTHRTSRDIIVRKIGDNSSIIEMQLSSLYNSNGMRPLDRSTYRSQFGLTIARALNWSDEYYFGDDSVSERLFDYRILANTIKNRALSVIRCEDVFLAGNIKIRQSDESVRGLGKRVLFVPMKYENTTDMSSFSLKRRPIENILNPQGSPYGCSRSDVESLIEYSGMFDMVNYQLIRDSYGQLSLDVNPSVSEDIILSVSGNPPQSPYNLLSEGLARASQTLEFWARIALAPFPLRPHMPDFKVWYRAPKDIIMTSTCSISTYHMIHELYHMLGYHHPYQYRVRRPSGGGIISPLDETGEWTMDNQYQESFDALGCCSGDASLSTRILNGWVTWEKSRVELFNNGQISAKEDFILYPFDSPEISNGKSALGVVLKMNATHTLVCGYRDLVRWPVSFNTHDTVLATRNNLRGVECELLMTITEDVVIRTTLDLSLLKEDIFHQYTGGDFHQRKIFSLLGEQMAFHAPQHNLRLIHKGLVPCNESIRGDEDVVVVEHFMGLRDEYPFQETHGTRATYSLQSRCAAIHISLGGDPPPLPVEEEWAMPIQFLASKATTGEMYLYVEWNTQKMAGVSFKTKTNETIQSFISQDESKPLASPLQVLSLSDPCLGQHIQRMDMIDYTGRSSSSTILYNKATKSLDISTRFSNNHNMAAATMQWSMPWHIQKECTSHSSLHIHNILHAFIIIAILFIYILRLLRGIPLMLLQGMQLMNEVSFQFLHRQHLILIHRQAFIQLQQRPTSTLFFAILHCLVEHPYSIRCRHKCFMTRRRLQGRNCTHISDGVTTTSVCMLCEIIWR